MQAILTLPAVPPFPSLAEEEAMVLFIGNVRVRRAAQQRRGKAVVQTIVARELESRAV